MHPKLLEIGTYFIPTYGALLALAYLLSLRLAVSLAQKDGVDGQKVFDMGLAMLVASILGSKLLAVFVDWEQYVENPRELLGLLRLAGVYYGGFLAALLTALFYMRRHGLPFWKVADAMAVALPLGTSVGRIGCLAAGCCYGAPAAWGWSITFHDEFAHLYIGVPLDIPLYPTQIYFSAAGLLTFAVLWILYRRRPYPGWVFAWFLLTFSALRFGLEYLRGDPRGTFMNTTLSTSQGISLVLIALGAALLFYLRKANRKITAEG